MIDWIKYFPLKLRSVEKAQSPKGSSFNRAKKIHCTVAGSKLSFKVPRHRPEFSYDKSIFHNYNDLMTYVARGFNRGVMADDNDDWRQMLFFHRSWAFYGPWFTGAQTELTMGMSIISKTEHQQGVSFFHPRAFEDIVSNYLTSRFGHETYGSENLWSAPHNWTPVNQLPVFSVIFDVMPQDNNVNGRNQLFIFPITDQHFLKVTMNHNYITHGSYKQRLETFDGKPMATLANDIINSFSLELSPEIQAQWDRVKADCPDKSLVKEFAPLKWPMEKAVSSFKPAAAAIAQSSSNK